MADGALLIQVDPISYGYPAPPGALAYSFSTNKLYVKIGGNLREWAQVPTSQEGIVQGRPGVDLTDADVTKNPASDAASLYTLPAATLSANRTLVLGTSGSPVTNSVVQVVRRDLTSKTYTVNDDAATPLIVFGASQSTPQGATFYYTGTHYALLNFFYVEV